MPDPRPLVRRRTVLGAPLAGLAATALLAGCDSGEDIAPPGADGSGSATPEPSEAAPEQTPDEALVDEVLAALTTALAVLAQARKAPAVRQHAVPLLKAHRRHVLVLEGDLENDVEDESPPGPLPGPAALRAVRRSETTLHSTLVDAAGRAESGALARLLASMSASVTQHLALLPANPPAQAVP